MAGSLKVNWEGLGGKARIMELKQKLGSMKLVAEQLSREAGRRISKGAIYSYADREGWHAELVATHAQVNTTEKVGELDIEQVKDRKIIQLQDHVQRLRQTNGKLQKQVINQLELADKLAAESAEPLSDPGFSRYRQTGGSKERDVILPIYDVQYGQLVRPEDTPAGIGGFNSEIFTQRLDRYVWASCNEIRDHATSHTEEKFIIVLGGDMVEGNDIFKGQQWFLEFDPIEQVWKLAHLLTNAIHELIGFAVEELGVKQTALLMIPGNHGKGNGHGAAPATFSWDYLLYKILQEKLQNYPMDVMGIEPGGALYFQSQGKTFLALHGDEFKGWAGIPFYGLQRQDSRSLRLTHTMFDYGLVGHHHQQANIPIGYGEWFMSGNWVGANDHTRKIQAANVPQQQVLFNSEKYGVSQISKIMLEERRVPEPEIYLA